MKKIILALMILINGSIMPQVREKEAISIKNKTEKNKSVITSLREIEKIVIRNNMQKPKLKLGLDLLRTDKNNEEVFLRKSEYPLALSNRDIYINNDFQFSVYGADISIPLEIYNQNKKVISEKSEKVKQAKLKYVLEAIPIKKVNDIYTFKLTIIGSYFNYGYNIYKGKKIENNLAVGYQKEISLRVGEKIKLDLELTKIPWQIDEMIHGENVSFSGRQDYNNYFNDYFVFYLEGEN